MIGTVYLVGIPFVLAAFILAVRASGERLPDVVARNVLGSLLLAGALLWPAVLAIAVLFFASKAIGKAAVR